MKRKICSLQKWHQMTQKTYTHIQDKRLKCYKYSIEIVRSSFILLFLVAFGSAILCL